MATSQNVRFLFTKDFNKYKNLEEKDPMALYYIEDATLGYYALYKGENLIAVGSAASEMTAGLMTPDDKQHLDELIASGGGIANLQPVDASIVISAGEDGKTNIGVAISAEEGNALEKRDDGLFVPTAIVADTKIDEKNANGLSYATEVGLGLSLATPDSAGAMSAIDKENLDKLVSWDIPTTYGKAYEISNKPVGTLVSYNGKEIRVMCPSDTEWTLQNVGENGDSSKYYIGFRAYAPSSNVTSFKESLATTMTDQTMYYFEDNEFAGVDANERKYSVVWLPVAKHSDDGTWTYYGTNSSKDKFIGWHYCVEWYDADGKCVASDLIRINLANEDCFNSVEPYYMTNYATKEEVSTAISWETL